MPLFQQGLRWNFRDHRGGLPAKTATKTPIADPDPRFPAGTTNDQAIRAVGDQGRALGAAFFSRCEGQVFQDGVVYFTATQGGGPAEASEGPHGGGFGNGTGQVWAYDTRAMTLTCVFQSPDDAVLDFPDNITFNDLNR